MPDTGLDTGGQKEISLTQYLSLRQTPTAAPDKIIKCYTRVPKKYQQTIKEGPSPDLSLWGGPHGGVFLRLSLKRL